MILLEWDPFPAISATHISKALLRPPSLLSIHRALVVTIGMWPNPKMFQSTLVFGGCILAALYSTLLVNVFFLKFLAHVTWDQRVR